MKTFAFLTHPVDNQQVRNIWPFAKLIPSLAVKPLLKFAPAFKISEIKNLRSATGKEINGFLVTVPLLFHQLLGLDEQYFQEKIVAAIEISVKLGAEILGLDSLFADSKFKAGEKFKLPLTRGDAFTAWTVIEAIYRAAKIKKIDLKQSSVSVIGAASSVGSLCVRRLAHCVAGVTITGSEPGILEELKEISDGDSTFGNISAKIELDTSKALKDADIVVIATLRNDFFVNMEEIKPGAIVCDLSLINNVKAQASARKEITVIGGGLVKLPFPVNFTLDSRLPKDVVSSRLAETMLLAFEDRLISRNLNNNTNLNKLEEIANIAVRHGFETWVPEAPVV